MRNILKHRFLALALTLALTSLGAGFAVSAACSRLIIYRNGDGTFLVCEFAGGVEYYPSGATVCSYVCNER